jgi:hypothetical protein
LANKEYVENEKQSGGIIFGGISFMLWRYNNRNRAKNSVDQPQTGVELVGFAAAF